MKRLLYIGHEYHSKTKSVAFLPDILRREYELEFVTIDPRTGGPGTNITRTSHKDYDVLVCFQVMPSIRAINP